MTSQSLGTNRMLRYVLPRGRFHRITFIHSGEGWELDAVGQLGLLVANGSSEARDLLFKSTGLHLKLATFVDPTDAPFRNDEAQQQGPLGEKETPDDRHADPVCCTNWFGRSFTLSRCPTGFIRNASRELRVLTLYPPRNISLGNSSPKPNPMTNPEAKIPRTSAPRSA